MDFRTKYGPWALVAGASEGLGAAWAQALARRGLNLVLLARREAALAQTAAAVRERHPVEVVTIAVDLASPGLGETLAPALQGREVGPRASSARRSKARPGSSSRTRSSRRHWVSSAAAPSRSPGSSTASSLS
jgi:NAD(P)-dependent dehydrogenase (short-subunit alcohol dehydrogenase family)